MTMGTGLFSIAVGAILRFAVKDEWDAVNLETVGLILMIVGVIGFVVGAFWAFGGNRRREAVVVQRDPRDPRYQGALPVAVRRRSGQLAQLGEAVRPARLVKSATRLGPERGPGERQLGRPPRSASVSVTTVSRSSGSGSSQRKVYATLAGGSTSRNSPER